MPDELLDIAHGDPRLARQVETMLRDLAKDGSPLMREMAQGVLDGGSLRQAAISDAYGEEVSAAFGDFWSKYQAMSPEEQAELGEVAEAALRGETTEA
ncbi:hypothetical protein OWR29_39090 [Actinoplanes sp. Pm04-4]|uniref:Uncharacterized protein n=1 Tax=Paractinoplanes pyxinae TaxID=2997416 RepID=A0ABT4BBZ0_9ACTN|nr:hypothetical protein [Actinoplanes pyxinae]MCY1144037.1 hypothetical protein [Actinoplanes pyxinae]